MFDIQGSFATGRNESVEENLETRSFIFVHTGNGKPIKEINRFVSKKLFLTNRFWLMNDINFDREMSKTITIEICVKLLKFVDINIYVNYLQKYRKELEFYFQRQIIIIPLFQFLFQRAIIVVLPNTSRNL